VVLMDKDSDDWINSFETLLVTRDDTILTVAFNRPERLNAFNHEMHEEFSELCDQIAHHREIRVVVVTGAGRAFSAGGDVQLLEDMSSGKISQSEQVLGGRRLLLRLLDIPQPVIAMVNGPAAGLGATIALHCDIVFASTTAIFADPHVQMGLAAGDGGAVIWPLLIGPVRAKHYLITGDSIDAELARSLGLVLEVCEPDALAQTSYAYARRLCEGPRVAMEGTKLAVNRHLKFWVDQVLDTSLLAELWSMQTEDHRQRVADFKARNFRRF
jgi:enoyl-CoA hydratase